MAYQDGGEVPEGEAVALDDVKRPHPDHHIRALRHHGGPSPPGLVRVGSGWLPGGRAVQGSTGGPSGTR